MTKSASNRADSTALMTYLSSPTAQEIYGSDNYKYPIAPST
jgi:ABC-type Fe3+ transport system substrate-binding protein